MAGQHFSPTAIVLFVAFLGFVLYRRFRRTVGRQPLVPGRLTFQVELLGLNHTRFERGPDRDYYTPNTYLGLAVFGLFLARLVYRWVQVSAQMQTLSASGQPPGAGMSSLTSSPLTSALLQMVIGYYLVYESGLLLWVRRNPPGQEIHGGFRQPRLL
jgi:hypothetical protein